MPGAGSTLSPGLRRRLGHVAMWHRVVPATTSGNGNATHRSTGVPTWAPGRLQKSAHSPSSAPATANKGHPIDVGPKTTLALCLGWVLQYPKDAGWWGRVPASSSAGPGPGIGRSKCARRALACLKEEKSHQKPTSVLDRQDNHEMRPVCLSPEKMLWETCNRL